MAWWMWMILGLVLASAEAQIPTNFFLLAFGVGGLIVGALTGVGWIAAPWVEWLVGRAELRGTTWSARGVDGVALVRGTRCRVERVDGLTLWLRPE